MRHSNNLPGIFTSDHFFTKITIQPSASAVVDKTQGFLLLHLILDNEKHKVIKGKQIGKCHEVRVRE